MRSSPIPRRALDVHADLDLTIDGRAVRIEGRGDRIVVDVPDARTGALLLKAAPRSGGPRRDDLAEADRALQAAGLTAEVRLGGDQFARLGARARPGAVARLFRLGNVEVTPVPAVVRVARERPAVAFGLGTLVAAFLAAVVRAIVRRD